MIDFHFLPYSRLWAASLQSLIAMAGQVLQMFWILILMDLLMQRRIPSSFGCLVWINLAQRLLLEVFWQEWVWTSVQHLVSLSCDEMIYKLTMFFSNIYSSRTFILSWWGTGYQTSSSTEFWNIALSNGLTFLVSGGISSWREGYGDVPGIANQASLCWQWGWRGGWSIVVF